MKSFVIDGVLTWKCKSRSHDMIMARRRSGRAGQAGLKKKRKKK